MTSARRSGESASFALLLHTIQRANCEDRYSETLVTDEELSKLHVRNQEAIKRSAAGGMGVTILSYLAAKEEIESGKLLAFPLGKAGGTRNINMVYDAGYPSLPAAEKFIKTVQQMYPEN